MTRLANLSIEYTLAKATVAVVPTGQGWHRWRLVTHYGEFLGLTDIERTKAQAQAAGAKVARAYNKKLAGKRKVWRRKNVRPGSPKNKISLWTGIA